MAAFSESYSPSIATHVNSSFLLHALGSPVHHDARINYACGVVTFLPALHSPCCISFTLYDQKGVDVAFSFQFLSAHSSTTLEMPAERADHRQHTHRSSQQQRHKHHGSNGPHHSERRRFPPAEATVKPASCVTPHDAAQSQLAQHGVSVVRSGTTADQGGAIMFFSSVQKRGGAFTASEKDTQMQLQRTRAIPRGGAATVNAVPTHELYASSSSRAGEQLRAKVAAEMRRRRREEVQQVAAMVRHQRCRFEADSTESDG